MFPSFISLFSGAGGLDLGLEQAGWKSVYASDIDSAAVASLRANRGFKVGRSRRALVEAFIDQSDIREASAKEILAKASVRKGDVPLLAGGPPCQSWSSAGHQHGFKDPRGRLFDDFIRIADGLDVRWLFLENVRGLLTARGADGVPGSALAHVRKRLLKAGFQTTVSLFNAADYGVPQRRVRLIMIGFRAGDPPPLPPPTHTKTPGLTHGKPWITLGEVLANVSPLMPGEIVRPTGMLAVELAMLAPGTGVKSPGKPEASRPGGHWGYKQGAFVADKKQSARTVTANSQQDWIRDRKHGLRKLCPRECAAIQGFPLDWVFEGTRSIQHRLIGNAVPPPLARHLGTALLRHTDTSSGARASLLDGLLPLPPRLMSAIAYTVRDEKKNGASRRETPARRISRFLADA
jgi:DNA (cytosine-5)-methyltransferase 1